MKTSLKLGLVMAMALGLVACGTTQPARSVGGAGVGAGTGAAIGATIGAVGGPIGVAAGAGAGALWGAVAGGAAGAVTTPDNVNLGAVPGSR